MITTSRYPSAKTRELAKRIAGKLRTFYVARGKKTIDGIAGHARKKGESEIIVIEEKDGIPEFASAIEVSETGKWKWARRTPVSEYAV
ncbi:hypothetical protein H0O02_00915 [Candidatus Micrarchaeota archaeon]|nr:hypothetical protein [Candidatus Micrarchaeota archaeon]